MRLLQSLCVRQLQCLCGRQLQCLCGRQLQCVVVQFSLAESISTVMGGE